MNNFYFELGSKVISGITGMTGITRITGITVKLVSDILLAF